MGQDPERGAGLAPWLWTGRTKEVRERPCWKWEVRCHRGEGYVKGQHKVRRRLA